MMALRAVSKSYREGDLLHRVLDRIELDLVRGETVVIRGPSGSGKSTILNMLGGLDLPDCGEVLFDGRNLVTASDDERTLMRRRHMGFVFQFFNLIEGLTVEENVRLPLELLGSACAASRREARALLERVGLADRASSLPNRLSGGEQQRVAILRALVHRPSVILADEPTGNLDASVTATVLDMLGDLVHETGACLVMATHSEVAATRGDRVLRLSGGRLTSS